MADTSAVIVGPISFLLKNEMIKTGTHFVHQTYMLVYMLQSLMTHERCHTSGPLAGTDPPPPDTHYREQ